MEEASSRHPAGNKFHHMLWLTDTSPWLNISLKQKGLANVLAKRIYHLLYFT